MLDGVRQISIVHGVGEVVSEIRSSSDRIGFVVAQGQDAVDAADKCERALKAIGIATEDVKKD